MKVLVAGATGAIGRPLVQQLAKNGHQVIAVARNPGVMPAADRILPAACDVLDAKAVDRLVAEHRPGAVVSQLTNLPKDFQPRKLKKAYPLTSQVRLEGTRNLLAASERSGVSQFVAQSSGFWYRPSPGMVKSETDPLWSDAPEPIGHAVRSLLEMEALVKASKGPRPVLLRYGTFYGPGTWFAREGTVGKLVSKGRYPLVGKAHAVTSFIHVEDAASATVAAVERPVKGVFNVCDDEPAPAREWVPYYAQVIGAKPPRTVPAWLAKLAIGSSLAEYTMNQRGADNSSAKKTLQWAPRYATWRHGFRKDLG